MKIPPVEAEMLHADGHVYEIRLKMGPRIRCKGVDWRNWGHNRDK